MVGMAEELRHWHGGHAVHGGVLDRSAGSAGSSGTGSVSGECAGNDESAGAQERRARVSVADEAAHLWFAGEFLSAAGGDPDDPDDLAAAEPAGEARHSEGRARSQGVGEIAG
jgi:hypothetical protein